MINPTEGSYYKINGTNRVLYWNGKEWMKPVKDKNGRLGYWIAPLETQPKNVKSIEELTLTES